jgi:hypothetical protein
LPFVPGAFPAAAAPGIDTLFDWSLRFIDSQSIIIIL